MKTAALKKLRKYKFLFTIALPVVVLAVANPKMRALTNWVPNSGTNSSGFTAYAAGFFGTNNQFAGLETQALFWSATESDANSANSAQLYNGVDEVFDYAVDKNAGMSYRCVKD